MECNLSSMTNLADLAEAGIHFTHPPFHLYDYFFYLYNLASFHPCHPCVPSQNRHRNIAHPGRKQDFLAGNSVSSSRSSSARSKGR